MITGSFGDAVDRIGWSVVHAAVDLETIALALGVFPRSRAQVAQRHLALAAVEFGDLAELRRVTLAGTAGKVIHNSSARSVDGCRAARIHQTKFVKPLMGKKTRAGRAGGAHIRTWRNDESSDPHYQRSVKRKPKSARHVSPFRGLRLES